MTEQPNERLSARITGRVHGVGFRAFVRRKARDLELHGWVCNEPDGTVRLEAEGSREALEALLDVVQSGPPAARVAHVAAGWDKATGTFDSFSVQY